MITGKGLSKKDQVAIKWGGKTDLRGRWSYGNGVRNMAGVKGTNVNIRLRIVNDTESDQTIYICPVHLLGTEIKRQAKAVTGYSVMNEMGLPVGVHFGAGAFDVADDETVTITSLNRDQLLALLAREMNNMPMQVMGVKMRSFTLTNEKESTNFGNTITHYNISSLRPKKYTDLNLTDFSTDKFQDSWLNIDFIKQKFHCPISQNDLMAVVVNSKTKLDITLAIGARDSREEYFYRDTVNGVEMLHEEFPNEVLKNCLD